jgi:hypothetical protein
MCPKPTKTESIPFSERGRHIVTTSDFQKTRKHMLELLFIMNSVDLRIKDVTFPSSTCLFVRTNPNIPPMASIIGV